MKEVEHGTPIEGFCIRLQVRHGVHDPEYGFQSYGPDVFCSFLVSDSLASNGEAVKDLFDKTLTAIKNKLSKT